jgi:hypothetical protein
LEATAKFQLINEAHTVLTDSELRLDYDRRRGLKPVHWHDEVPWWLLCFGLFLGCLVTEALSKLFRSLSVGMIVAFWRDAWGVLVYLYRLLAAQCAASAQI